MIKKKKTNQTNKEKAEQLNKLGIEGNFT